MKIKISATPHHSAQLIPLTEEAVSGLIDFNGRNGEISVRYDGKTTQIYIGVGKQELSDHRILRSAAAKGVHKALELKKTKLSLVFPVGKWVTKQKSIALVEGVLLGSYKFSKYKSEKPPRIEILEVVSSLLSASDIKKTSLLCDSVNYARDLVNENASEITPERLAQEARSIASSFGMKVTVLDEKEISRKKLGLLKAVGQGSIYPPRLIILEYQGNRKTKEKSAIIGKGVTFDSGGQNLKPSGSIESMREDMAGAAAVLGTMRTIGALKPSINVVAVIAAAQNAIGPKSYFPGDVYRSHSGKTVEICNTDAEGRLILADAISYCCKVYAPTSIIDLATLTGGVLISFSDVVAGLFSNNDPLAQQLFEAGEKCGERLWRMPVYQEYSDSLKSDICDLRNISKLKRGHAGSIIGAAFLKEFTGDLPWAHLDIAGTAFNEGAAKGETPQFGTGFGVRLLITHLIK